jgi:hypothetical protein
MGARSAFVFPVKTNVVNLMKKLSASLLLLGVCATASFAQVKTKSALAEGEIVKIGIGESGIYKLDYSYLKNIAKLDVDKLDPRKLKIYGNGGGMLNGYIAPGYNNHERDLTENSIRVVGEEDGKFDAGDYILFYAQGPQVWAYDTVSRFYTAPVNVFDTRNYYFLKVDIENGLRVQPAASAAEGAYVATAFDDFARLEDEKRNLLKDWPLGQGSGQDWYGDYFKSVRSKVYSEPFRFSNIVPGSTAKVRAEMAARAFGSNTYFRVFAGGQEFRSGVFSAIFRGESDDTYAYQRSASGSFTASSDQLQVTVEYPEFGFNSEAWLDFIELNVRRQLRMTGTQMSFRDAATLAAASTEYRLSGASERLRIWEISAPLAPTEQTGTVSGDIFSFKKLTAGKLREFVAFDPQSPLLAPASAEKISNQNLHALQQVDLLIVYHPEFEAAVKQLADHRRSFHGYSVATVPIGQVWNEFASGRNDPVAIRDLAKMLFDRDTARFRFLLLFGDGSFDYRNIYGNGGNFVPVYETRESLDPVDAFPADDYFALLTPGDGDGLSGNLDIAVGRIPVSTKAEAEAVVAKIIRYELEPQTLRAWRNYLCFVSDDEDGTLHIGPSDKVATFVENNFPDFNLKKIYADAYPQVSTSGGQKYPSVNEAIDQTVYRGILVINYFGHGGPKGWGQERFLKIESILNWENLERLPLFVTATCSFTGYDSPEFKSAGEEVFLNPRGGAIALFSTTRAVYVSGNVVLTEAVFQRLFEKVNGVYPTLGQILKRAKNEGGASYTNSRKFTMIGDPSMHLALPEYKVVTTRINTHDVSDGVPDTLSALQRVTIAGEIHDDDDQLMSGFNGSVYTVIFDKKTEVRTLRQDPGSVVYPFTVQENVLFKGKASVRDGKFRFTFVMPKDIDYDYGYGKISYYATDEKSIDAKGNYTNIVIGKTDPNALADNEGPRVEVFINNENFKSGGMTDENPVILVKLEDDNGINVAGSSIGHDLVAVLDDDTRATYNLNEFYEAALDDFTRGEARYPLFRLPEGRHRVKVTAWDIANNAGEGFTEFIVTSSEEGAIRQVLNFPNPFVDRTCFTFEHNLAGQELEVQIQIFSVSGNLVKTIKSNFTPSGYLLGPGDCIEWDGLSDSGAALARGVYLYRVRIRTTGAGPAPLTQESNFQKLVVLK